MKLRVVIEPHDGATHADQLAAARAAEELGFDGFFRSDHYMPLPGNDGLPGPTDAWTTLAGSRLPRADGLADHAPGLTATASCAYPQSDFT